MKERVTLRLPAATAHQRRNLQAAKHILLNIEKYGGLDAGLVGWARRIVAATAADEKLAPATGQPRLPGLEVQRG